MPTEEPSEPGLCAVAMESDHFIRLAQDALDVMNTEEAAYFFSRAEAEGHNPDVCSAGRWTCHMLNGDFERAWLESDAIEQRGQPDPHRFWDGESFAGKKVMLRCLHGLGDTIQFIRFASKIRAQAHSLVIEAQPVLKTLLERAGIGDAVITWGEAEPEWDQQVEVNELPRIFRAGTFELPSTVPYLSVSNAQTSVIADRTEKVRVGLVWASSEYNPLRSIPLRLLLPLLETPGVAFFSLQAGAGCKELRHWSDKIVNLSEHAMSVLETAEYMSQMDLVISVDTMTAHLAGALGVRVWTLLPSPCDWRWMKAGEESPWYPTMKLFRQANRGDWERAVCQLTTEFQSFLANRSTFRPVTS